MNQLRGDFQIIRQQKGRSKVGKSDRKINTSVDLK